MNANQGHERIATRPPQVGAIFSLATDDSTTVQQLDTTTRVPLATSVFEKVKDIYLFILFHQSTVMNVRLVA